MKRTNSISKKLVSLVLALALTMSLVLPCLTSCELDLSTLIPGLGSGNGEGEGDEGEGDGDVNLTIDPVAYGEEYRHTTGDMDVDTRFNLGKADVITDKHLVFQANITSFEGLRIGHGYENYTSAYLVIDDTYITQYWYLKEETMIRQYKH